MSISKMLQSAANRFLTKDENLSDSAGLSDSADLADDDTTAAKTGKKNGDSFDDFKDLSFADEELCRQAAAIINRIGVGAQRAKNQLDLDYSKKLASTAKVLQDALQNVVQTGEYKA